MRKDTVKRISGNVDSPKMRTARCFPVTWRVSKKSCRDALETGVGVWRLRTLGPKGALISVVRVLIYGGFALFILFCGVLVIHYATGGH